MALTELQSNDSLETKDQPLEGQYSVRDFSLGISNQAMFRGLEVVHQVGLQLQTRRSPGSLAQEIIRILESKIGYDNGAILLVDRLARQLKPFALSERAFGRDFSQAYERYVDSHELRLGVGVPGWVAHHGKSLLYGDITREPRLESLKTEMRSMLFVPILVEGVTVGTLGVESRLADAFAPLDQQLLETVAGQIAIAIQNAHLYSRLRLQPMESQGTSGPAQPNGKNPSVSAKPTPESTAIVEVEGREDNEAIAEARQPEPQPVKAPTPPLRHNAAPDNTQEVLTELRAQIEELTAFNHTVAHDLKNPLSILMGFADILGHNYASSNDEVLDQAVRVIIENGRRMENIINELLLLAEVRTVEQIPLTPLDMPGVVSEVNRRLSNLIKEYDAQIIAPESWPQVMGHQPWVEEIWFNYLSNAIKYGGPSPRVEVGADSIDPDTVRFWVRDFGEGIDPADQLRLFIPFTQLQQANTKGHGLGLSIVQRIVKRLGGAVGVESELGKGTLFWFTLPAIPRLSTQA